MYKISFDLFTDAVSPIYIILSFLHGNFLWYLVKPMTKIRFYIVNQTSKY